MPPKTRWAVPLSQAIPVLVAAVAIVGFVFNVRAERRELLRALNEASDDRFRGRDMDLFIERLQVVFDSHTRADKKPTVVMPNWRQTR